MLVLDLGSHRGGGGRGHGRLGHSYRRAGAGEHEGETRGLAF